MKIKVRGSPEGERQNTRKNVFIYNWSRKTYPIFCGFLKRIVFIRLFLWKFRVSEKENSSNFVCFVMQWGHNDKQTDEKRNNGCACAVYMICIPRCAVLSDEYVVFPFIAAALCPLVIDWAYSKYRLILNHDDLFDHPSNQTVSCILLEFLGFDIRTGLLWPSISITAYVMAFILFYWLYHSVASPFMWHYYLFVFSFLHWMRTYSSIGGHSF